MGERRSIVIIGSCITAFVALVLVWALTPSGKDQSPLPANLTEVTDSASIQELIDLSHISIATGENYFGHKVRLIHGVLKNVSDKPIRVVDVKMVFTDSDGNSIHESTQRTFEHTQKPLSPGQEYRFEVGFENLPREWNYRIPVTDVVKVGY